MKRYLFIDTSYFEKQNFLHGNQLKELSRLSHLGLLKVKITDIVYREIQERIRKNLSMTAQQIKRNSKFFEREGRILRNLQGYQLFYRRNRFLLENEIEYLLQKFNEFISYSKIEVIETNGSVTERVFQYYFSNHPPFGDGNKKHEFPDAFSVLTIEEYSKVNRAKALFLTMDKDFEMFNSESIEIICNPSSLLETIYKSEQYQSINEFSEYETTLIANTRRIIEVIERDSADDISDLAERYYLDEDAQLDDIDINEVIVKEVDNLQVIGRDNFLIFKIDCFLLSAGLIYYGGPTSESNMKGDENLNWFPHYCLPFKIEGKFVIHLSVWLQDEYNLIDWDSMKIYDFQKTDEQSLQ